MRMLVRIVAVVLLGGTLVWWFQSGKNAGWTKNRVAVERVDEITGINFTEYEDRFIPGIEYPVAAGVAAIGLTGLSFIRRRRVVPGAAGEVQ